MIQTEQAYDEAIDCVDVLFNSSKDTPDGDLLDELIEMVVAYEDVHYPI